MLSASPAAGEQHPEKPWAVPPMRRTGVEKRWKPGRISSPVVLVGDKAAAWQQHGQIL